jgi:hypothetical protein
MYYVLNNVFNMNVLINFVKYCLIFLQQQMELI